jgi:hypothetical protein
MTLVQSDGEVKFTFDGVARVIPAGVSEQSDNLVEFARRKGVKIRRITAGQAELLAAPPVDPLGPPKRKPKGVFESIADALSRPVSPSR